MELSKEFKAELKDYNKTIETRKEQIEKLKEKIYNKEKFDGFDKSIENKMNEVVINLLKEKGFNFEKDRLSAYGNKLNIVNNQLKIRGYKNHYWHKISLLEDYDIEETLDYFGNSFSLIIFKLKNTLKEIKELKNKLSLKNNNDERDIINCSKKVNIKIEYLNDYEDDGIRKREIDKLDYKDILDTKDFLINDDFFNTCLELIGEQKKAISKIQDEITKKYQEILFKLDNFKGLMVAEEL